jgi:hypothetical protein
MRLALLAVTAASMSVAADACQLAPTESVIHSSLPDQLPKGAFVARVIIGAGKPLQMFQGAGIRARVLQVLQGDENERYVLLQRSHISSCDNEFLNGRLGYIVAVPRGRKAGLLIVDPIMVSRSERFRLPENFEISESMRAGHTIVDWEAIKKANAAADPR